MRHALESLAVAAPDWLRAQAQPDWAGRCGHRAVDDRLAKPAARREERARTIGGDGHALLAAALDPAAPDWLRQVPAVETLRRVWVQQFYVSAESVQCRTAQQPRGGTSRSTSPARADERWQARAGKGFAAAGCSVDRERKQATCPQGGVSASWTPALDSRGAQVIKIKFSSSDGGPCRHPAGCTRDTRARRWWAHGTGKRRRSLPR